MEEVYEAEVVPDNSAAKRKNIRTIICFVILFITTSLGFAAGSAYHAITETVFESRATFQANFRKVEPPIEGLDLTSITNVRHDQLFVQSNFIADCFQRNKLMHLRSFEDIPEDMVVEEVQANLTVNNEKDPAIYEVVYCSKRPADAQTVLNNLIAGYERWINQKEEAIVNQYQTVIKNEHEALLTDLKRLEGTETHDEDAIGSVKKKVAEATDKLLRLERFQAINGSVSGTFQNGVLSAATYGYPVWPVLPLNLLIGTSIGFGLGFALILFWFIIRTLS